MVIYRLKSKLNGGSLCIALESFHWISARHLSVFLGYMLGPEHTRIGRVGSELANSVSYLSNVVEERCLLLADSVGRTSMYIRLLQHLVVQYSPVPTMCRIGPWLPATQIDSSDMVPLSSSTR